MCCGWFCGKRLVIVSRELAVVFDVNNALVQFLLKSDTVSFSALDKVLTPLFILYILQFMIYSPYWCVCVCVCVCVSHVPVLRMGCIHLARQNSAVNCSSFCVLWHWCPVSVCTWYKLAPYHFLWTSFMKVCVYVCVCVCVCT